MEVLINLNLSVQQGRGLSCGGDFLALQEGYTCVPRIQERSREATLEVDRPIPYWAVGSGQQRRFL